MLFVLKSLFNMENQFSGSIGLAFLAMEESATVGISKITDIKSEAFTFLTLWKKEFKINQAEIRKQKRKRGKDVRATENVPLDPLENLRPSGRPTRSARNVAINNIRKQTLLPLNRKMRRPDSNDLEDNGIILSGYIHRNTVSNVMGEEEVKVNMEGSKNDKEAFPKPKMPRKQKDKKIDPVIEEKSEVHQKISDKLLSVNDIIAGPEQIEPVPKARIHDSSKSSLKDQVPVVAGIGNKIDLVNTNENKEKRSSKSLSAPRIRSSKRKTEDNAETADGDDAKQALIDENHKATERNIKCKIADNSSKVEKAVTEQKRNSNRLGVNITEIVSRPTRSKSRADTLNEPKTTLPRPQSVEIFFEPRHNCLVPQSVDVRNEPRRQTRSRSTDVVNEPSPAISPVPFSPGVPQIINESLEDSTMNLKPMRSTSHDIENDRNISNVASNSENNMGPSKPKKKKGLNLSVSFFEDTENENDLKLEETLQSKGGRTRKGKKLNESCTSSDTSELSELRATVTRTKRTKARKGQDEHNSQINCYNAFVPAAESSLVVEDLEKTRVVTPKNLNNGTFVVGSGGMESEFFGSGPETVVRANRVKKNEQACSFDKSPIEKALNDVDFQVPLPIASKRTKPIVNSKTYDCDGNLIIRTNTARTKTLNAPTVQGLPEVPVGEGRPIRIRTKVRRFGMDDDYEDESIQLTNTMEVMNDTTESQRVTRTKTKALQKAVEDESLRVAKAISRKSKAKRASQVFNQQPLIKALVSSDKRLKTPLSTVTNNLSAKRPMIILNSATKENYMIPKKKLRTEEAMKIIIKPAEGQLLEEREAKLKSKQQKEELAAKKKLEAIIKKRELLKQKNEEKLQRALKCRAKMEEEKYEQIVQIEKEKEQKRKLILQERELKQKAEINKKKMLTEKKLADHEERRRMDEEARLAKIRDMEAEQQRQLQEKQKQMEYEEKRAKERQEEIRKMLEAEKLMKQKKAQADKEEAQKKQKMKCYTGKYLPRNENDLGLEDEVSEASDADEPDTPSKPNPKWVKGLKKGNPVWNWISLHQISLFMPLLSKTPNVQKMFNMSPKRQLRRTSSAIWNTSVSTPS